MRETFFIRVSDEDRPSSVGISVRPCDSRDWFPVPTLLEGLLQLLSTEGLRMSLKDEVVIRGRRSGAEYSVEVLLCLGKEGDRIRVDFLDLPGLLLPLEFLDEAQPPIMTEGLHGFDIVTLSDPELRTVPVLVDTPAVEISRQRS